MSSHWDSFVARLQDEARRTLRNNRTDGVCIITTHVVVDQDGNPIVWTVPNSVRIEPTRVARDVLLSLLSSPKLT